METDKLPTPSLVMATKKPSLTRPGPWRLTNGHHSLGMATNETKLD